MRSSPIYKNARWNQMLEGAVVMLLALVALDMFFYEQIEQNKLLNVLLEILELFLILVVFLDLIIKLSFSTKKYVFVRHHMFAIISAFPFTLSMKTLRLVEAASIISKIAFVEFLLNLLGWDKFNHFVGKTKRVVRHTIRNFNVIPPF